MLIASTFVPRPGLGVSQAGHFECAAVLDTMHVGHSQLPSVFWKRLDRLPVGAGVASVRAGLLACTHTQG